MPFLYWLFHPAAHPWIVFFVADLFNIVAVLVVTAAHSFRCLFEASRVCPSLIAIKETADDKDRLFSISFITLRFSV